MRRGGIRVERRHRFPSATRTGAPHTNQKTTHDHGAGHADISTGNVCTVGPGMFGTIHPGDHPMLAQVTPARCFHCWQCTSPIMKEQATHHTCHCRQHQDVIRLGILFQQVDHGLRIQRQSRRPTEIRDHRTVCQDQTVHRWIVGSIRHPIWTHFVHGTPAIDNVGGISFTRAVVHGKE